MPEPDAESDDEANPGRDADSALETHTFVYRVDPARLADGVWCSRRQKCVGQGDINASYSADRIGEGKSIRKPFNHEAARWVCTSLRPYGPGSAAEAYRLVAAASFSGKPRSYGERVAAGDAARFDPRGFYDGVNVLQGGRQLILQGPAVLFVPGQPKQLELF